MDAGQPGPNRATFVQWLRLWGVSALVDARHENFYRRPDAGMAERRTRDLSGLHGAHRSASRLEHPDKILRRLGSGEKANSLGRRLGQTRGLEPHLRRPKGGDLSDEGYDAGILNRSPCINS